jgi:cytochrome P450
MVIDRSFLTDPYPLYAALLEGEVLQWAPLFGGVWICGRYRECIHLLRDPHLTSQGSGTFTATFSPEEHEEVTELKRMLSGWLVFHDGATHRRIRQALYSNFEPAALGQFQDRIRRVSARLVSRFDEQGGGDFMREIAYPMPCLVLGDLLGIDESEHPTLIRWTEEIADFFGGMPPTIELARAAQTAMREAATLFRELIPQRRASPRDDLLTRLVAGNLSAPLSDEELALQCTLLMFAGHETTRSLAGNAVLTLLRHP